MAHKKAGKHKEENWEEVLSRLSEDAQEEMHEKIGLILEALETMETTLVGAGTVLSHVTYSQEFGSFYGLPWDEIPEELELFVSPEKDGYTYRCWVSPVSYRDGDEFVFLYRDNGKELEAYMEDDGWVLAGEPMEGLFEEEEEEGQEEEEVFCQVADMVDAFMDDQELVGDMVTEKEELLKELLMDAKAYLEEPCFVLDPEGERLQNRHPDRVGRVKTAFLEEKLTYLVCNTGISTKAKFEDYSMEEWDHIVKTNLTVPTFLVQRLLPRMEKGGSILFVGSYAGQQAYSASLVYGVTKAGIHFLTKSLVKETEKVGVRVNAIAPGFIETRWHAGRSEESRERIEKKVALHRFGTVEEVADMAFAVLTNGYMNGSVVDIHGGYDYF